MKMIGSLWLTLLFLSFKCDGQSTTSTLPATSSMNASTATYTPTSIKGTQQHSSTTIGQSSTTVVASSTTNLNVATSTTDAILPSSTQPSINRTHSLTSTLSNSFSHPSSSIGTTALTTAPHPTSSSPSAYTTATPGKPGDSDKDSEPKTELYVWQLVAIGCGVFVFILFIIIGLLCYQNQILKKKLVASRSYSLPIKENGAWIDNQDIPLWQKRASAFVSETPAGSGEEGPTLTT